MPESSAERRTDWGTVALAASLIAGLVALFTLEVETSAAHEVGGAITTVKEMASWAALGIEVFSGLVVTVGVVACVASFALHVIRPAKETFDAIGSLRLQLGRVLTLGLEITLAADILQVAFHPTRAELLTAAIVVLLRTLLNLFLEREIRTVEERTGQDAMEPVE